MKEIKSQYPSGRPIRKTEIKRLGFVRIPQDGPLTPGLRKRQDAVNAIGFTAQLNKDNDQ